jgi:hypothetical protein
MTDAQTLHASATTTPDVVSRPWLKTGLAHVSTILVPVSLGLWAFGMSQAKAGELGPFGLPAVLPVVFYIGVALLITSVGFELAQAKLRPWRMALHAIVLVVMLYGTAPLVYPAGRYSWLYKTIGVVQYVNAHGQLNRFIDIYQNWPGFFALMAWFDKVAGVASPLVYAKWSQLVVELAALPLLYLCYGALRLPARQRWVALLLYSASNWIAQDYFSPQALGTLLSLGIAAITLRWLYAGNTAGIPLGILRRLRRRQAESYGDAEPDQKRLNAVTSFLKSWRPGRSDRESAPFFAVVLVIFFVLTFTHELSPYLLIVQFGLLAVLGFVRPRWLPVAFAAIAVAYLVPRFAYVNSHYGVLKSIGAFFSNAAPPSFYSGPQPLSQRVIQYSADLLSAFVWGLALLGAWPRRRSGRTVLTLLVLTFAPFFVLGLVAYGNEGLLRVYLFSLPWAAALAAAALAPQPATDADHEPRWSAMRRMAALVRATGRRVQPLAVPLALGIAVTLFFPAFFGDDYFNRMPQGQVSAITAFLTIAPPGPIYTPVANSAPLADTARYSQFPEHDIFGPFSVLGRKHVTRKVAKQLAADAKTLVGQHGAAYVLITSGMLHYIKSYGLAPPRDVSMLLKSMRRSHRWVRVRVHQPGVQLYELPPQARALPAR